MLRALRSLFTRKKKFEDMGTQDLIRIVASHVESIYDVELSEDKLFLLGRFIDLYDKCKDIECFDEWLSIKMYSQLQEGAQAYIVRELEACWAESNGKTATTNNEV